MRFLVVIALVIIVGSGSASGQGAIDASTPARLHLGPVGLTPAIAINAVGVDNNVFNEAEDPKRDFSGTVVPAADALLRAGRVSARLKGEVSLIYFQRYTNQRAVNTAQDVTVSAALHRVTPFVRLQYVNARERPTIEVDSRVRRRNMIVASGADVAFGPKLSVRVEAHRFRTAFDDTDVDGSNLRVLLNQQATAADASLRYQLTPLTRVILLAQRQQDRFEFTPLRNADSLRLSPSVEFAPTALITGRASVGVRSFDVADPLVRDFTGVVAAVDLAYTLRGATRFAVRADRDVAYSFSVLSPYYVLISVGGTVAQRLTVQWEVTTFAERQRLTYRTIRAVVPTSAGAVAGALEATAATDPDGAIGLYGGSVGYRFGRSSRMSFIVDYSNRTAGLRGRYKNVRAYTTINYGF